MNTCLHTPTYQNILRRARPNFGRGRGIIAHPFSWGLQTPLFQQLHPSQNLDPIERPPSPRANLRQKYSGDSISRMGSQTTCRKRTPRHLNPVGSGPGHRERWGMREFSRHIWRTTPIRGVGIGRPIRAPPPPKEYVQKPCCVA